MDNRKGQSSVEFLIAFVFSLGILFLFVQMVLMSGRGYLTHYASFMLGRTYLVYDRFDYANDGEGNIELLRRMANGFDLDVFDINIENFELLLSEETKPEFTGPILRFKQKMSFFSPVGGSQELELVSPGLLGREPTKSKCIQAICERFSKIGSINDCENSIDITAFDNGC